MKGFKTFGYGILIALIAVISDETVKTFVNENFATVGSVLGGLVILLRSVTSSSIFKAK